MLMGAVFINVKTKIMQKSALGGAKLWPQALLKTLLIMKLAIFILCYSPHFR
jgi:hypothetical protein